MENLFEQFAGADLDRLTDCLQEIRKNGLKVDKWTQAGVNQGSGNVWVWNEDWPGCVYCSIGFDVAWSYSCPDCGEEHDFESFSEMSDCAERFDGYCSTCRPKFVAGWNMPGFLPDSDPVEFDDAETALGYVTDMMLDDSDSDVWTAEDIQMIPTLKANPDGEFGLTMHGKHYFVARAD